MFPQHIDIMFAQHSIRNFTFLVRNLGYVFALHDEIRTDFWSWEIHYAKYVKNVSELRKNHVVRTGSCYSNRVIFLGVGNCVFHDPYSSYLWKLMVRLHYERKSPKLVWNIRTVIEWTKHRRRFRFSAFCGESFAPKDLQFRFCKIKGVNTLEA